MMTAPNAGAGMYWKATVRNFSANNTTVPVNRPPAGVATLLCAFTADLQEKSS